MAKQESQLLDNLNGSASYWQYRYNQAEYEKKQPYIQVNQNTDDTWFIMLGILGTIGFLVLLAVKVL
jgi:hypothetical protein